jgi:iron complex transport system substrate-binding protein
MQFKLSIFFPGVFILLAGCAPPSEKATAPAEGLKKDSTIKYAKRFAIRNGNGYSAVYLFGNKQNYDTTATYFIYSDSVVPRGIPKNAVSIKIPCKKIAALSSIYATMLCELGVIENIAAIDNIDYVNNRQIIKKHESGFLKELARTPQIDLEKTITLNPDVVFTFGMGEWEKDVDKKLEQTGIPVIISLDHKEESPLARAEWIKFFGIFVDKRKEADSIFNGVEKNYYALKAVASNVSNRPTVFNEIKYSDSWYVPGGKSYVAQLLRDAGADYLWKGDQNFGSLPLSFEQVFARAKDADFWINLSTLKTKKELLSFESRYAEFKAYKTGNLFNNTKVTNKFGYSNYWETGMIYPDRILSDLISVFHPELKPQVGNELYYYERLK